jgi:hypothetical protein
MFHIVMHLTLFFFCLSSNFVFGRSFCWRQGSQPAIPPFKPVHAFLEEQLPCLANAIR